MNKMFEKPNCVEYVETSKRVRKICVRRRILWFAGTILFIAIAAVIAIFLSGCSTDDELDICCEGVVLHYRYVRQEEDEYKSFLRNMRHFLFDEQGVFIKELPSNKVNPQNLRINNISKGNYTVITIGNTSTINTRLSELVDTQSKMDAFRLLVGNRQENGMYLNSDDLFWNVRSFTVFPNKMERYLCDLSNIHCHLFVRVFWHVLPKYEGDYTMRLSHVPTGYLLNPHETKKIVIKDEEPISGDIETPLRVTHRFPALSGEFGRHEIKVSLYNLELEGEFITLRYTDNHIPVFQLFFGDEVVSKPIDLSKAFNSWGWIPDNHPEQIYRIEMEIFEDGTVIVNQWSDTAVLDWQDGGVIGVEQ